MADEMLEVADKMPEPVERPAEEEGRRMPTAEVETGAPDDEMDA
jgi:hypothetical protein